MSGRGGGRVCSFFLQGRCKYGNNCKNEHPKPDNNRYDAFNNSTSKSQSDRGREATRSEQNLPYNLSKDSIIADLRDERPQWPFSCYGPGKNAPRQLFEGYPLETSFEEMRLMYYVAATVGNPEQAIKYENDLLAQSDQQRQQALSNVDAAIQYVIDGEKQRPNRLDRVRSTQSNAPDSRNDTSVFGSAEQASRSAFGTPSFGQPSVSSSSQAPAQTGFGQAGGFGPARSGTSVFGQPSAPFGSQSSVFSQPPATSVGAHSQTVASSPFARVENTGADASNGFGQPSISHTAQSLSPFARPTVSHTNASPFQATQSLQHGPIGGFASMSSGASGSFPQATSVSPFASMNSALTHNGQSGANVLMEDASQQRTSDHRSLDGQSATPDPSTYIRLDRNNHAISFKNEAVQYIDNEAFVTSLRTGKLERIWFPSGPPPPNRYGQEAAEVYAAAGHALNDAYRHVATTGSYMDGIMPEIAPQRLWVRFDL